MIKKVSLLFLIAVLLSCGKAPKQISNGYFDLTGYFKKESVKLKKHKTINKTVVINKSRESKQVHIPDWEKELSAFIAADINKAAWKDVFRIETTPEHQLYVTANEKVPVKKLLIEKRNNKILHINIILKRINMLYTSIDTLDYYPDSLYSIRKIQRIKLLAEKRYSIQGNLK